VNLFVLAGKLLDDLSILQLPKVFYFEQVSWRMILVGQSPTVRLTALLTTRKEMAELDAL